MQVVNDAGNRLRRKAAFKWAARQHENAAHRHEAAADLLFLVGDRDGAEAEMTLALEELSAARTDANRAAWQ